MRYARYWYARSPEFLQTDVVETFRWLRVIGDTVFAAGALALAAFVIGLRTGVGISPCSRSTPVKG